MYQLTMNLKCEFAEGTLHFETKNREEMKYPGGGGIPSVCSKLLPENCIQFFCNNLYLSILLIW